MEYEPHSGHFSGPALVSITAGPWLGSEQLLQFPTEGIAVVLPEPIHKARILNRSLSRVFFLLFVLAATAWAVDPHTLISQYGHTAWRIQDGFLSDPGAIAQTTDGYIWIGVLGGLMRFDGVKFTPWTAPKGQALPGNGISSLLGGRDGSLWIGTYRGLSRLKNGELFNYTTTPNSPG